jgi:hypothetical protein
MIKRSLLAASIAAISAQSALAAPFMPMDARGLAMGNTGVASAQRAHAPAYNPSLLSQASDDDDFAIIFPQFGVSVADEEELVDSAQDINDEVVPKFEELFEDGVAGNFTASIQALDAAATSLSNEVNSVATNDGRTPAQKANDLRSRASDFDNALDTVESQLVEVNGVTSDLTKRLDSISGDPLRGRLGVGTALAIPSKSFAAALSINADVNFAGRTVFTRQDQNLINAYGQAASDFVQTAKDQAISTQIDTIATRVENNDIPTQAQLNPIVASVDTVANYTSPDTVDTAAGDIRIFENGALSTQAEDAELNSQIEVIAVAVAELGLSLSREFDIQGEKIAIGITPKLQKVSTFHYVSELDNEEDIETDDIEDSQEDSSKVNLDIGASYRFGAENNWTVGLVAKNLLGGDFDVADAEIKGSAPADCDNNPATPNEVCTLEGGKVSLNPQYRAGLAYSSDWINVAADLDLVENDPIAFENPTQYASIGAELDVFSTLQLRAGYRTNLSVSNAEVVSVGLGFSPFGIHIDIAAMANPSDPEKEAGVALETGFYF